MHCGTQLASLTLEPRRVRKTVTVLFSDIVDSTGLTDRSDVELSNLVLSRFYEEARRVLERYEGSVQKYIGDAVMGLFGVPVLHEDDALRAVKAAADLRAALPALNRELERERDWRMPLSLRTAVNTGEVVVTDRVAGSPEPAVLGDAINVASRLQHEAGPDEILIGEATYRLVRDQVVAERVGSRLLKGKESPVTVWRLRSVQPEPRTRVRRFEAPMVGREPELELFRGIYERTVTERSCHLLTVLGEAGVGKTRLIEELEHQIERQATVRYGWCRPYGGDIALGPVTQIIRRGAGIQMGGSPSEAEAKLAALTDHDERIVHRVAQALGLREGSGEPKDMYWALRRVLELLAGKDPLVMVIEDLHHAQPALLEFVEHVADRSRNAPILLVCLARPEFLDRHRAWGGTLNSSSFLLSPLTRPQSEQLVGHLLGHSVLDSQVRAQIADMTEGNPLFTEELIANLTEAGTLQLVDGRWIVAGDLASMRTTPRIDAVLTARLDRLTPEEQAVIERAAVIGTQFQAAEVVALSPPAKQRLVPATLVDLVRKELLTFGAAQLSLPDSHEVLRFRHTLIRDAAYQAIPKDRRAWLHQGYADWLERPEGNRAAHSRELLGRHLEEAYRYQVELGRQDDATRVLARRAGEHRAVAGRHGLLRGDAPMSAADLLARAVTLLAENDAVRRDALLDLADARRETGENLSALKAYDEALEAARAASDEVRATRAVLGQLEVGSDFDLERFLAEGPAAVARGLEVFERLGDDLNLANTWRLRAFIEAAVGRSTTAQDAATRAITFAQRAGDERLEARNLSMHCYILDWGPAHVAEVRQRSQQALDWAKRRGVRGLEKDASNILARATAMQGDFERSREFLTAVRSIKVDVSDPLFSVSDTLTAASVELLDNQPGAAEELLRRGGADPREPGELRPHPIVLTLLARAPEPRPLRGGRAPDTPLPGGCRSKPARRADQMAGASCRGARAPRRPDQRRTLGKGGGRVRRALRATRFPGSGLRRPGRGVAGGRAE